MTCSAHKTLKTNQTVECYQCSEDVKVPTWDTLEVTCSHCAAVFKVADLFDHTALDCSQGWERARLESHKAILAIVDATPSAGRFPPVTWED